MKSIIFLTFAISCFAQSGADPDDIGYSLALGPLEFFLKLEKEEVSTCYIECNKGAYENSILSFLKRLSEIKDIVNNAFPVSSTSKNYITWGLNEMNNIGNSLNSFFGDLKGNIFNGKLFDGGKVIWRQRSNIENHYKQYLKHGKDLKNRNNHHYKSTFSLMDDAFKKILEKSHELIHKLLECLEGKSLTYTKKNT